MGSGLCPHGHLLQVLFLCHNDIWKVIEARSRLRLSVPSIRPYTLGYIVAQSMCQEKEGWRGYHIFPQLLCVHEPDHTQVLSLILVEMDVLKKT